MQGFNVIVVLSPDNKKMLMCRRVKEPYLGLLNMVGGKIEPNEDGEAAAFRELYEETGITDIKLVHLMDFSYPLDDCYVEVYAGQLRETREVFGEENPLLWVDLSEDFFDMKKFAGEGNIGHIMEHVKLHADKILINGGVEIIDGKDRIDEIKELIIEYVESIGRDLSFQGLDEELSDLAHKYCEPNGRLLCAVTQSGEICGCVAYHKHTAERCEMKRLYVKPEFRRKHIGERMGFKIVELARGNGFKEMVLDTSSEYYWALSLYKKLGFSECEAYYDNPMDDVVYMRLYL